MTDGVLQAVQAAVFDDVMKTLLVSDDLWMWMKKQIVLEDFLKNIPSAGELMLIYDVGDEVKGLLRLFGDLKGWGLTKKLR